MEIFLQILAVLGISLAIILVVLLISKVTVSVAFSKKDEKKPLTVIRLSILRGIVKKEIRIPDKSKKKKEGRKPESVEKFGDENEKFIDKAKKAYKKFLIFKAVYKKNSCKIRKAILLEKISFSLNFGTGDAAKTGIAVGTLWASFYNIIAFVSRFVTVTKPDAQITPFYSEKKLSVDAGCIITARVANLIKTALSILISYYFINKKYQKNKQKGGD